ncbi:hypothetical protein PAXRUDRAFT_824787 [Paxillus rubicundulus Ve08.2h10]|uniref:Uncharacterized protein n=1 Tax=Paxillus rubicundulus Ve08.2h10 TaxID=930991 RepID=A0A0D0E1D0_9AGAM|nr:hypothetical protein PAXRUDRAFT_824787 [Paxillus rubicundulus Ve08.2h10]
MAKEQIFWVATAALNGHVNVSPKGSSDCFHVVSKNQIWYEDLTGSEEWPKVLGLRHVDEISFPGIETITHTR